jgi:hypothetical protein
MELTKDQGLDWIRINELFGSWMYKFAQMPENETITEEALGSRRVSLLWLVWGMDTALFIRRVLLSHKAWLQLLATKHAQQTSFRIALLFFYGIILCMHR